MPICRFVPLAAALLAGALAHSALAQTTPPAPTATPRPPAPGNTKPQPMVMAKSVEHLRAERIAKALIAASPVADPADTAARDAAAEKLAACDDLIKAAGGSGGNGRILWGGFNPAQGYDPIAYRLSDRAHDDYFQLTEFVPVVWAKLYLSTFMFPGPYTIRQEGTFTVLELDAKFREAMPPGEYPYPFWHSPNKWTAYVKVEKVMFIFEPGRLVAAMRKSPDPVSIEQIRRPWDTKWQWTDDKGNPQPRVSLYSYLFAKDNPHVAPLEKTYRELEKTFRAQNCMMCHEPDNRSRINDLLLLNYPSQALIARRSLVTILETNAMPPGDELAHEPEGIRDKAILTDLTRLAKLFEKQADDAFAYEQSRAAAPKTDDAKTDDAKPDAPHKPG
jgi:hypothetical protein